MFIERLSDEHVLETSIPCEGVTEGYEYDKISKVKMPANSAFKGYLFDATILNETAPYSTRGEYDVHIDYVSDPISGNDYVSLYDPQHGMNKIRVLLEDFMNAISNAKKSRIEEGAKGDFDYEPYGKVTTRKLSLPSEYHVGLEEIDGHLNNSYKIPHAHDRGFSYINVPEGDNIVHGEHEGYEVTTFELRSNQKIELTEYLYDESAEFDVKAQPKREDSKMIDVDYFCDEVRDTLFKGNINRDPEKNTCSIALRTTEHCGTLMYEGKKYCYRDLSEDSGLGGNCVLIPVDEIGNGENSIDWIKEHPYDFEMKMHDTAEVLIVKGDFTENGVENGEVVGKLSAKEFSEMSLNSDTFYGPAEKTYKNRADKVLKEVENRETQNVTFTIPKNAVVRDEKCWAVRLPNNDETTGLCFMGEHALVDNGHGGYTVTLKKGEVTPSLSTPGGALNGVPGNTSRVDYKAEDLQKIFEGKTAVDFIRKRDKAEKANHLFNSR